MKTSRPRGATQQERDNYVPLPVAASLRNLLGRRLLREGHYADAVAYFDNPDLQNKARLYGEQRLKADAAWWPTKRASALYNAAWTAREWGMDILGYEMAPDYATFGGNYSLEIRRAESRPAGDRSRSAAPEGQRSATGSALSLPVCRHRAGQSRRRQPAAHQSGVCRRAVQRPQAGTAAWKSRARCISVT